MRRKVNYWAVGIFVALVVVAVGAVALLRPGYDPKTGEVAYSLPSFKERPVIVVQTAIKAPQKSSEIVKTSEGRTVYRETTQVDIDPIDEISKMKASVEAARRTLAEQVQETKKTVSEQVSSLKESAGESAKKRIADLEEMISKLRDEMKMQVASASAPAAPAAAQAPASQGAPAAQSSGAYPKVAQAEGKIGLVVPKGFHLTTTLGEENQAKMRRCTTQLVLDIKSPRCFMQGSTRICPWKCEK
jgi:hypothetical protein